MINKPGRLPLFVHSVSSQKNWSLGNKATEDSHQTTRTKLLGCQLLMSHQCRTHLLYKCKQTHNCPFDLRIAALLRFVWSGWSGSPHATQLEYFLVCVKENLFPGGLVRKCLWSGTVVNNVLCVSRIIDVLSVMLNCDVIVCAGESKGTTPERT